MITSLPVTVNNTNALPTWVAQHCTSTSLVLDVGAGRGRIKSIATVKKR
jgi:hypothetical protein